MICENDHCRDKNEDRQLMLGFPAKVNLHGLAQTRHSWSPWVGDPSSADCLVPHVQCCPSPPCVLYCRVLIL